MSHFLLRRGWTLVCLLLCACTARRVVSREPLGLYRASAAVEEPPGRSTLYRLFRLGAEPQSGSVLFAMTGEKCPPEEVPCYAIWPTIFTRQAGRWQVVELKDDLMHYSWIHAAAAPARGYFWGFLEYTVEGPAQELPLLLSQDGGQSWRLIHIPKPIYLAGFSSFSMGVDGRGELRMEDPFLEWDSSSAQSPAATRRFWTYTTEDWGQTWRRHEEPAQDVLEQGAGPRGDPWECERNLVEDAPLTPECALPEDG